MALHRLMVEEALVPSPGWEMRRKLVIHKLKSIVSSWTKRGPQLASSLGKINESASADC
ncbi:nuclear poly(A) polymerase 3 isoform X2 [Senna tora]|uniref:Nuclear poly(A) polymerase 3 isoform X2 n=1 Tax=Senna tora TaxID=362788 RepID=A0A834TG02_9FABA|nr:nuclear poly(A) polymerase 3 isoform X2 [Senna tora]